MTPKEVDELMEKRNFSLGAKTGTGIRMYTYSDITRIPRVLVEVIPDRDEFRISYMHHKSINRIESPWCSPLRDKAHFKRILAGVKKWARKIEELYEDEGE